MIVATPASIAARNGRSSQASSACPIRRDHRHVVVRVDGGVAVAGKVLGARGHAGGLQAANPGGGMAGDEVRIGAERAHADHRVVRVGVDVGVGGEVERDAEAGEFLTQMASDRRGQVDIVGGAEREVAGAGAAAVRLQARHVAGFLVDADDDVVGFGPQCRGEGRDLLRRVDVSCVEEDRTQAAARSVDGSSPGASVPSKPG